MKMQKTGQFNNGNYDYGKQNRVLTLLLRGDIYKGMSMATTRISNGDGWREGITPYSPSGAAATALCVPYSLRDVRCDVCVMATQRVGGYDHPTKVQQRRAQTDIHFFCTPGAIVTLLVSSSSDFAKMCANCPYFEPIEDNSIYRKPYDGHCGINGDLVFDDDVCDFFE